MAGGIVRRVIAVLTQSVWPTITTTFRRWGEDDGWLLSAAMAYSAAFSLFPLCLILIAGLSWMSRVSPAWHAQRLELIDVVQRNAGSWVAEQVQRLLQGVDTNAIVGGPLGLATLGIGAIGIFLQFDAIFDRIWQTTAPPITGFLSLLHRLLIDRIVAFSMLLGVGAVLITMSLASLTADGLQRFVDRLPAGASVWSFMQPGIALVLNAIVFCVIYKVIPKVHVRWLEAFAGGVIVSIVWHLGQVALARIVISSKYSAYGVVGSFVAIMAWMYYASATIFLGAEFVRVLGDDRRNGVEKPGSKAPA